MDKVCFKANLIGLDMKIRKLPFHIRLQEWWFYHVRFPFLMWWDGVTLKQIQKRNNRRERLYKVLKLIAKDETQEPVRRTNKKQ